MPYAQATPLDAADGIVIFEVFALVGAMTAWGWVRLASNALCVPLVIHAVSSYDSCTVVPCRKSMHPPNRLPHPEIEDQH